MNEARTAPSPAAETSARRRRVAQPSIYANGEPLVWLTGGALLVCLVMIAGLLALVVAYGAMTFWPHDLVRVSTADGGVFLGEVSRTDTFVPDSGVLANLPPAAAARAADEMARNEGRLRRELLRTANFAVYQNHFTWVSDCMIEETVRPPDALVLEQLDRGRFHGFARALVVATERLDAPSLEEKRAEARRLAAARTPEHGGTLQVLAEAVRDGATATVVLPLERMDEATDILALAEVVADQEALWRAFPAFHERVRDAWRSRRSLEKHDMGTINRSEEEARLALREAELALADAEAESGPASAAWTAAQGSLRAAQERYEEARARAAKDFAAIRDRIDAIDRDNGRYKLLVATAGEGSKPPAEVMVGLDDIVRAYRPNGLSFGEKFAVNLSRWWEYLSDEPREANTEGGIFPAIVGTVVMTLLMAVAVVPFGVLASLYLREYAKAGPIVSAIRIAVNNLAGVPSIVYGVFGLGFFCYGVGGFIDGGPAYALPKPTWFLLLGGAAVGALLAFGALMLGMKRPGERLLFRHRAFKFVSALLWIAFSAAVVLLIAMTPFFHGFYRAGLPNPTFGKGALIWASLTLALLTLPVVIVATEEALSAVPNSLREGSYACGAGKWQTIRRIVMPRAMPGIMTGMILAMARGAGEVAPLMLVGAVKLAQELPVALEPPFGLNRSFMHLGFHIYDLAFQSQNAEAAKPMVFTTTLLLITIVATLNMAAIGLRSRLRRRFVSDRF